MLTFDPINALSSVDLPALGAPISAIKPQRVRTSAIKLIRRHADACQHGGGSGLLGSTLGAAEPFCRRLVGQHDGNAEFWIVVRSSARQFAVCRGWKPARLRPLL